MLHLDIHDVNDLIRNSERIEVSCEGRGEPIVIRWHQVERITKTIVTQGDDPVVAKAEECRRFTTRTRLAWPDLSSMVGKVCRICDGACQRMQALSGRERTAEFAVMLRAAALIGRLLEMQTVAMPLEFSFHYEPAPRIHSRQDRQKTEEKLREFGERWIADIIAGHKRTCDAYLAFCSKIKPHMEALS